MARACHSTPRRPLQNHPSRHLEGWSTKWSAEEMLDGQHQRVGIPAHLRPAHEGLLQKRQEEYLCCLVLHVSRTFQWNKGLDGTEMNAEFSPEMYGRGPRFPGSGERGKLYSTLHCHHQNDSALRHLHNTFKANVKIELTTARQNGPAG